MTERMISIKEFADELYMSKRLQKIPLEAIIRYTINFMRIVGVPNMFFEKCEKLDIKNYRAELPCDFYMPMQVRSLGKNYTGTYRAATDTFHLSPEHRNIRELTYTIQGHIIYTSVKEDTIEIAYKAIPVDEYGFPLIPDNSSFTRALKAFIKKEHYTDEFDEGNLDIRVLQNAQQDYAFAVGACETEYQRMSLDEAEAFYNIWSNLVVRANEHVKTFANSGSKELLKVV